MEYMQLLQNMFTNSMENDKDVIILNKKCCLKKEIAKKRGHHAKIHNAGPQLPRGLWAGIHLG